MSRILLHADLDAFYASVEQLDHPHLRGKPIAVGGPAEGRGVVAAASYEARAYGVRSAQPMSQAMRRCPDLITVRPRFDRYRELSGRVMALLRKRTELVEPLSLDEAYLDVTASLGDWDTATVEGFARELQDEAAAETGLSLSVGAGTTKSVAKIASDLRKPHGLVVVPAGEERAFLAPLPVNRLWGVGPRAEERLLRLGITTIGDLAATDPVWFSARYGKWGGLLHDLAQGIDTRAVTPHRDQKSIGRETTFAHDVSAHAELATTLTHLAESVANSLKRKGLFARTITLKLRDAAFATHTRQTRLAQPTDDAATISAVALALLDRELRPGSRLRLIGVATANFDDAPLQLPLPLWPDADTSLLAQFTPQRADTLIDAEVVRAH